MNTKVKALSLFFAGLLIAQNSNATMMLNNHGTKVRSLFVQTATSANLTKSTTHPGYYQLTLKNVPDYVNYFTDSPYRTTGTIAVAKFSQLWSPTSDGFISSLPNADISGVIKNTGQFINLAVELVSIHYDKARHSISYTVQPLHGDRRLMQEFKLGHTNLFIDDQPYCWGDNCPPPS